MVVYTNDNIVIESSYRQGYTQACLLIRGMLVYIREKLHDEESQKLVDLVIDDVYKMGRGADEIIGDRSRDHGTRLS